MIRLVFLLLFASNAMAIQLDFDHALSKRNFSETLRAAEEIFALCPPEKCLLVSLGRHNALLDSFLRVLSGSESYLYEIPYLKIRDISGSEQFDVLVPPRELVGERQVVFLRSVGMGLSMSMVLRKIVDHVTQTYARERLGAVFVADFHDAFETQLRRMLSDIQVGGPTHIVEANTSAIRFTAYHRFLEFKDFAKPALVPNAIYKRLDNYLRDRICASKVAP